MLTGYQQGAAAKLFTEFTETKKYSTEVMPMLNGTAEDFIDELIHDPQRLMFIAKMSKEQRGEALRAIGFHFSAKELDNCLCRQYYSIAPALVFLGDGDVRDMIIVIILKNINGWTYTASVHPYYSLMKH